jgi:hypothetical protein
LKEIGSGRTVTFESGEVKHSPPPIVEEEEEEEEEESPAPIDQRISDEPDVEANEEESDDSMEALRLKYEAEARLLDHGRVVKGAELDKLLSRFSTDSDPFVES